MYITLRTLESTGNVYYISSGLADITMVWKVECIECPFKRAFTHPMILERWITVSG